MYIVYTGEKLPYSFSKSLFLAGPTPSTKEVLSWRPDALKILQMHGYDGVVIVPEDRPGSPSQTDKKLVQDWEHRGLYAADRILFWIPRDLATLPGFTTNIEIGLFANSGKMVVGAPSDAPKMEYIRHLCDKFFIPRFITLEETITHALQGIGDGAPRLGGETYVPLNVWRMRAFQNWYQAQKNAGNHLEDIQIEWVSRVRNKPDAIFIVGMRPQVYITNEKRLKVNDPIVSRLDISAVMLYKSDPDPMKTQIAITREFRTAASTSDGLIWELPGGSSPHLTDPQEIAAEEVHEEVGLRITQDRLIPRGARQLAGTLSSHKAHYFSAEVTDEELDWLKQQKGIPHGTGLTDPSGEQAYIEVCTLGEILEKQLVDWSTLGMILSVISSAEEVKE